VVQDLPESSENINHMFNFLSEAERRMDTNSWTTILSIIKFGFGPDWEILASEAERILIKFCKTSELQIWEELIIYLELAEFNYRLSE